MLQRKVNFTISALIIAIVGLGATLIITHVANETEFVGFTTDTLQ